MKILILGFQRSGTTLLRRIINCHPQVRRIFHESFLLTRYNNKKSLIQFLEKYNVNIKTETWGEKVPYYPNLRRYHTTRYCEKWNEYFGNQSRIIHIVRHPYDVAFSIINKYANERKFDKPLSMYCRKVINSIPEISALPNTLTIKYEELLTNTDETVELIYDFCGINPKFDYKKSLSNLSNPKYQKIDAGRAFAYKGKKIKSNIDLTEVLRVANIIDGPVYKK